MPENQKHPYRKGKIKHFGRDLSTRWYVEYKVWDVQKESLELRKKYGGINRYHTIEERMAAAKNLLSAINKELEKGKTIGSTKTKTKQIRDLTITEALEFAFTIKQQHTEETNWKYYKTILKHFPVWLETNGCHRLRITQLNPEIMNDYFDHLCETSIKSNKTFNNYLTYFNALFRQLNKRDRSIFTLAIPTDGIDFRNYSTNKHHAYSKDQIREVRKVCLEMGFHNLWNFIQTVYYTLARPIEIYRIQVRHIEMDTNRIYIPGDESKNKSGAYIDIYGPFREVLQKWKLMDYPLDYYIFSKNGDPGPEQFYDRYFWKQHVQVLEITGLNKLGRKFDLYAYKHSGTINLYLSGVELYDIMRQCRHKTPEQTMKYLRDLDLFRKKDHLDKVAGI